MLRLSYFPALGATALVTALSVASAQQKSVTLSPFLTLSSAGTSQSMAGLAFTIGGGSLGVRTGGHMSTQSRPPAATSSTATTRPWGMDLDALAYLESIRYLDLITLTPYVFTGLSTAAVDSASSRSTQRGWSYGSGMALPMGRSFGMFAEWRWRMSKFVLPNAADAPSATNEARIGMSFRVGGGGGGAAIPVILSGEGGTVWEGAQSPSAARSRLISTAEEYVGTRYRRGGTSPSAGFDASGFVRFVFAQFGVILPRTSRDQARVGDRVQTDWHIIEPGDLLMFQDDGGINHVAIYVGGNRIIHSSETGGGVRYDDLSSERGRWFLEHMVGARRVTPDLRGLLLDLARGVDDRSDEVDRPDHAPREVIRRRR